MYYLTRIRRYHVWSTRIESVSMLVSMPIYDLLRDISVRKQLINTKTSLVAVLNIYNIGAALGMHGPEAPDPRYFTNEEIVCSLEVSLMRRMQMIRL